MLQVVRQANSQRKNHQRRICVTTGGKHRCAGDVESADPMNAAIPVDDALLGIIRHARRAHGVGHVDDGRVIETILLYPRIQSGQRQSDTVEFPRHLLAKSRQGSPGVAIYLPIDLSAGDAEFILRL